MKNFEKKEISKDYWTREAEKLQNKKNIGLIKFISIFIIIMFFLPVTISIMKKYDNYKKNSYTELLYKELNLKNKDINKLLKYYRKLGEINIYQKNYDIAYEDLTKVLEIGGKELLKNKSLSKQMFLNFYTLGDVYEKKGEKDKALKNYKIAKDINVKYLNSYKKYLLFIDEKILKIEGGK